MGGLHWPGDQVHEVSVRCGRHRHRAVGMVDFQTEGGSAGCWGTSQTTPPLGGSGGTGGWRRRFFSGVFRKTYLLSVARRHQAAEAAPQGLVFANVRSPPPRRNGNGNNPSPHLPLSGSKKARVERLNAAQAVVAAAVSPFSGLTQPSSSALGGGAERLECGVIT